MNIEKIRNAISEFKILLRTNELSKHRDEMYWFHTFIMSMMIMGMKKSTGLSLESCIENFAKDLKKECLKNG